MFIVYLVVISAIFMDSKYKPCFHYIYDGWNLRMGYTVLGLITLLYNSSCKLIVSCNLSQCVTSYIKHAI